MAGYLDSNEIDAVRDTAVTAFPEPHMRQFLVNDIMPAYVAALPYLPVPALQITSDLMKMNAVERLIDGTVPLQIWLHNAARLTLEPGPRAVFQKAYDKVSAAAAGEPDLGPATDVTELPEEIIFQDDTVPFGFLAAGSTAGAAVGRLKVPPYQNGARQATPLGAPQNPHGGTGWLITPALIVTNYHVLRARTTVNGQAPAVSEADLALQAGETVVSFDYDTEQSDCAEVKCRAAVAWSLELDYAVLQLSEPSARTALPIRQSALTATLDDHVAVNVIQHPDGHAKRIGLRNNIVHDTTERDVRYFTDTQRGSSGSPVLTDDWVVCALHRGAKRVDVKFQGKPSSYVNVGTQMSAILADLKTRYPAVHGEIQSNQ